MAPAGRVAAAAALSAACCPVAGALARRLGLVDHPGPLKPQAQAVPYLGGVAVFLGAAVVPPVDRPRVLAPMGMALALGLTDDAMSLSPGLRLACEVGIGAALAGVVPIRMAIVPGTVAVTGATVVLVNAVNLVDGLDGLAGGVVLASALGFVGVLDGADRSLAAGVAAAVAGFLVFNRPPARIYLGDGGAYLLGTLLALLLASAWRPGLRWSASVGALPLVSYPVAEVVFAMVRRHRGRRPLFSGDRDHLYDRLAARWGSGTTALACAGLQGACTGVALLAVRLRPKGAALVVAALAVTLLGAAGAGGFLAPRLDPELDLDRPHPAR